MRFRHTAEAMAAEMQPWPIIPRARALDEEVTSLIFADRELTAEEHRFLARIEARAETMEDNHADQ